MTVARTAADVLSGHTTLEIEAVDRMYLNLYVPPLQRELGVVGFFKHHRGKPFASGALMQPITDAFVAGMHRFADEQEQEICRAMEPLLDQPGRGARDRIKRDGDDLMAAPPGRDLQV